MLSSLQNPRQAAVQLMNFGLILSTAFMVRSLRVAPCRLPFQFQLQDANVACLADVERPLGHLRLAVTDRRRPLRQHGAGLPARRSAPTMEPQPLLRNERGRSRRVQREGQGYSDCAPGGQEIRHWVRLPRSQTGRVADS